MRPLTRRRLRFLAGFAAYFMALWLLWPTPLVYPLKIFVVLLHEMSHGMAAIATGGTVQRIVLNPAQGGATYTTGGNAFLILSAGYLGSLLWGLLLLEAARLRPSRLKLVLAALGAIVLGTTLVYVRSWFGLLFGVVFGLALLAGARRLSPAVQAVLLTALGLTSSLYALLDIRSDILQRPDLPSDAHMLAQLTGVPTLLWGGLWALIAILASALMFRRIYRRV